MSNINRKHLQTFYKTTSKYFVIKIGAPGYSFSKKLPVDFDKSRAAKSLLSKVQNYEDVFIICRSNAASINCLEFDQEAEKAINYLQAIKANLDQIVYILTDWLVRSLWKSIVTSCIKLKGEEFLTN